MRGALVRRGRDVLRVPAEPVEAVDTTGAGDAFVAGFLAAVAGRGDPADLPREDLERAAAFACRVAGRVVARAGAVAGLPRKGEISV